MSSLESISSGTTRDIENLAHSMAVIHNAQPRSLRAARHGVRSNPSPTVQEFDDGDDLFAEHTDSLEQLRSAQRELVGEELPGKGGPEGFPDPYYEPSP